MLVTQPPDRTTTVTIPSGTETAGVIQYHTHQYFAIQQPPERDVLQQASLQGAAFNLASSNPVISIGVCGFLVGLGLATGLLASDPSRATGGYSVAALGTIGALYAAYSACKGVAGCSNVCGTAFKVIGFGATIGALSFFANYY